MKSLHNALYFKSGDKHIILRNGVHQGSPISPALFDIYMEEVMAKLQESLGKEIELWYKLYADDLVMIVRHNHVERLLDDLFRISGDFGLKVNEKKSGIFQNKGHKRLSGGTIERAARGSKQKPE